MQVVTLAIVLRDPVLSRNGIQNYALITYVHKLP